MNSEIQNAIEALTKRAKDAQPHEAMQLAQAALNLAHTAATARDAFASHARDCMRAAQGSN